jgi:DNA-binding MarR family transcriptional regulator
MNKAVQLLIEWDQFEQNNPQADIEQFCRYYLAQKEHKTKDHSQGQGYLLKIIGRIASAFNVYHRAAMSKTKLPSPESFYFLNGLAQLGEVKKTELINYLFTEYTKGMEVISKLLEHGLIVEKTDENDKRAKLLSLTKKGKTALQESYNQSAKASQMIFNGMNADSVQLCIQLLKGVEEKNSRLAPEVKGLDFEEMYKRVCGDA